MARADTLSKLYANKGTALEFNYDLLTAPPLLSLIPMRDIEYLYKIVTSIRYNSKLDFKKSEMKRVLEYYGFKKLHAGTHRIAWRHLEYPTIILKVPLNKSSLMDNIREYQNQSFLKPFCTKVFETTPDGLLGLFEKVDPIQSREEYESVASDVFDFLNEKIIGKYIVDDIGTESFMNIGLRTVKTCGYSFGPVLLDFPEVYPLDGSKLYCNASKNGVYCGGAIDYDPGFNTIRCTKCGRTYEARELRKAEENHEIIKEGASKNMRIVLKRGDQVVDVIDSKKAPVDVIQKPERRVPDSEKIVGRKPYALKKYEQKMKKQQRKNNFNNDQNDNRQKPIESDAKYYGTTNEKVTTPVKEKVDEALHKEVDADTGFIPKEEVKVEDSQPAVEVNVDALASSMMAVSKEDASDEYMKKMDELEAKADEDDGDEEDAAAEPDMDITIDPADIAAAAEREISDAENDSEVVEASQETEEDEEESQESSVNPLIG
mgnify:CR=1 FL=1